MFDIPGIGNYQMSILNSIGLHRIGLILVLDRHNLIAKKILAIAVLLAAGCINGPLSAGKVHRL